ncbi:restriction endonuclease subunit S [Flavobacterium sp.]|uniref:restriction endonuclease subunit S n=1 Tax=Flavobacterium sp. TaxID=239 RepID=UPI0025D8C932|nr:restriction endonuclease subunit S [Flavobacterium sp.]
MPNNWKTYKISEVTKLSTGFAFKSKDYENNGTLKVIRGINVTEGKLRWADDSRFWNHSEKEYSKYLVELDDIVIGMDGSKIGKNRAIVRDNDLPSILAQRVARIQSIPNLSCQKYIWQLINNSQFENYIYNIQTGTSIPHISLGQIGNYEIKLPSYKEQQSISSILSTIDDKIENNLAINKTLEEMAMALYKHWFVDFGPFQNGEFVESELGLIPKGWELKRLDEIAYKRAESYKFNGKERVVFVNTGDVLEGSFMHNNYMDIDELPGQAKKAIYPGDILFSEIRPANKRYAYVDFDSQDYVVSTKFMVIRNSNLINNKLLYRILTREETTAEFQNIAESRSGTFPQITFDVVGHIQFALPSIDLQNEFQSIVGCWEEQQSNNLKENKSLTQLRDTLLPKLINGEIRLKEFKEKVV